MAYNIALVSLTGSSYYVGAYANELAQNEHTNHLHVFVPSFSQELEVLDDSVDVVQIPIDDGIASSLKFSANPLRIREFFSELHRNDTDIVHFINEMRVPFYFTYIAKMLSDCPIILTVHEPNPEVPTSIRRTVLNPLQKLNLSALSRPVNRFIVHGEILKQELSNLGPQNENIHVVPHGSFANFFQNSASDVSQEPATVLFFGRADPGKGIPYLIKATKDLQQEIPNLRVILARYDSETYGSLDSNIFETYENRLSEQKVAEVFQRASVVVLPYTDASISGIVSIAAGFSTPVVVTNAGSLSELVDHKSTGMIVPPGDAEALHDVLNKILNNEDMINRMGQRLSRVQKEMYSWKRVVDKSIPVYQSCCSVDRSR